MAGIVSGWHASLFSKGAVAACIGMPARLFLALFLVHSAIPAIAYAVAPAITSGDSRSCALSATGGALCWGSDAGGALGDGGAVLSRVPIQVSGLVTGSRAIATSASARHTCAITNTGGLVCWGNNASGQLGTGTTANSTVPAPVVGASSGAVAVAIGGFHTCAINTAGAVYCWGANGYGQLGNSSIGTGGTVSLVAVPDLRSGVTAVAAGSLHTCALRSGAVLCWGSNSDGQLGNGTTTDSSAPVPVNGLSAGVVAISAGMFHTCALTASGGVLCWGENGTGQLGNGTTTDGLVPVAVGGLPAGVFRIATGGYHTCAIAPGGVRCWGWNRYGSLGNGTTSDSSLPVAVSGLQAGAVDLALGYSHSCARTSAGGVQCWGSNSWGEFGDGTFNSSLTPVPTTGLTEPVVALVAGVEHVCALTSGGRALCWGGNSFFQLGNGVVLGKSAPVAVSGLTSGVVAIATGGAHTCAVSASGSVQCWGAGPNGQLGTAQMDFTSSIPQQTLISSGATALAAGGNHTCAIVVSGGVLCWGNNSSGQLGNGTTTSSSRPVAVAGLPSPVTAITAGTAHTCALTSAGAVFCWGSNASGTLGNNSRVSSTVPVPVTGLGSGVRAIGAGGGHTCAVTAARGLVCWGYNLYGQLGNGNRTDSETPVAVTGLSSGVASIEGGEWHTCAVTVAGAVVCWGINRYGQLGNGTTTDSAVPMPVAGLSAGIAAVATGKRHTCALGVAGDVSCWGFNPVGALGDATFADRLKPASVAREGGVGSIAGRDWFLDLDPAVAKEVPPERIPTFLAKTSGNATTAIVDVAASLQFRSQDIGRQASVFAFAVAPVSLVTTSKSDAAPLVLGWAKSRSDGKEAPVACVLAQLSQSGQLIAVTASQLQAYQSGTLSAQGASMSLLNGVPSTNVAGATFYVGYGANASAMLSTGLNRSAVSVPGDVQCQPEPPQTGWWWNPLEDGRGFSLEVRGNNIFFASFLYDVTGRSTWYVSTGPVSLDGSLYIGDLLSARGGQSLGGAYPGFPTLASVGQITLAFNTASQGTMVWPGGTVPIQRFNIVPNGLALPPVAGQPESGWWWNEQEAGRGFFLEWQGGNLDIAGYMYDAAGNSVWYLTTGPIGGTETARSFGGNWWSFGNGQTLTGPWKPNARLSDNVAPVTIQFSGPDTAFMTLPNGRTTNLRRHRF